MLLRFLTLISLLAISEPAFAEGGVGGALQGAAAITAAVAPIAVAGIQASADKAIAGINAQTALGVTAIQNDTTKYLAAANAEVALAQSQAALEINKINNDGQTERLGMQLAEVRASRESAMQAEREKRWIEMYYNEQRIQLAKEQAAANYELARQTLQAQLVAAGLVSGVKRIDSSAGLTVTRTGLMGGGGGDPMLASASVDQGLSRVQGNSGGLSVMRGIDGQLSFSGVGPRSATTKRLLASALGASPTASVARGSTSFGLLGNSLGQGSTRGVRFKAVAMNTPAPTRSPASVVEGEWRGPRTEEAPVTQFGGHRGAN